MKQKFFHLKTGKLILDFDKDLKILTSIGSRINKKRGFLFISKILGKHLDTNPFIMNKLYKDLSKKLPNDNKKTLIIGFAETATALGLGIYHKLNNNNFFYAQSTRYKSKKQNPFFIFKEEHSHAPKHYFYLKSKINLNTIERIILIDDEVTTGNTALNIKNKLIKILPNTKEYYLVSILNSVKNSSIDKEFKQIYLKKINNLNFISYNINNIKLFNSNPNKQINIDCYINNINIHEKNGLNKNNLIYYRKVINKINLSMKNKKILVIGSGEFMYLPYLLANKLKKRGNKVYYKAFTRSPINIDGCIKNKIQFKDPYNEKIDMFLYNMQYYPNIIIYFENKKMNNEIKIILKKLKKYTNHLYYILNNKPYLY